MSDYERSRFRDATTVAAEWAEAQTRRAAAPGASRTPVAAAAKRATGARAKSPTPPRGLAGAARGIVVPAPLSLTYTVLGRPVTWARTNEYKGRRLTDEAQKQAKAAHQWAAKGHAWGKVWPLEGLFSIDVVGYYPTNVVGDTDRLASLALDALQCTHRCKHGHNGIAYHDDRQVRDVRSRIVVDPSVSPHVLVTVTRLEGA